MTAEEFNEIVGSIQKDIDRVLTDKSKEYAVGGDRLYNFKVAARVNDTSMAKALWGMATKHLICVQDLVNGVLEPTDYMLDEKIGDMINYLILLKAVLIDEREQKDKVRIVLDKKHCVSPSFTHSGGLCKNYNGNAVCNAGYVSCRYPGQECPGYTPEEKKK